MASLNKVELLGQLVREPETRTSSSGEAVCAFMVAVSQEVLNFRNEPVNETCYIEVEAFGRAGELVQGFFHKDMMIFVDGRLHYESWFDRDSNRKKNRLVVVADIIQQPEPDGSPLPVPPEEMEQGPQNAQYAPGFPSEPASGNGMTF